MQAGVELAFAVLPESPALFEPGKGSLNNPSSGENCESVKFRAFGDFHRGTQKGFHLLSEGLSRVAAISQYRQHIFKGFFLPLKRGNGPFAICYIGCGHRDGVRQPLRINRNVPFDPRDFLARVIAFVLCAIGIFYALRINDAEAG